MPTLLGWFLTLFRLIFAYIGGLSIFTVYVTGDGFVPGLLISGACFFLSQLIANERARQEREGAIRQSDQFTQFLLQKDDAAPLPSFVLFLRPFEMTENVPLKGPASGWRNGAGSMLPQSYLDEKIEFEQALREAVKPRELAALGSPEDLERSYGAIRVEVDERDWKAAFGRLSDAASRIVVVASDTEGTVWELREILSRGLSKHTLFVTIDEVDAEVSLKALNMIDKEINKLELTTSMTARSVRRSIRNKIRSHGVKSVSPKRAADAIRHLSHFICDESESHAIKDGFWQYMKDGEISEPIKEDELKNKISSGDLPLHTRVRSADSLFWVPADTLNGFLSEKITTNVERGNNNISYDQYNYEETSATTITYIIIFILFVVLVVAVLSINQL